MRSALLRFVLVALLLAAQHAALTHAIWHAHGDASPARELHAADGNARGEHAPERALCVFDVALGQVLGGAHGSGCHFHGAELVSESIAPSARPYSGVLSLSFHSRAPPALL